MRTRAAFITPCYSLLVFDNCNKQPNTRLALWVLSLDGRQIHETWCCYIGNCAGEIATLDRPLLWFRSCGWGSAVMKAVSIVLSNHQWHPLSHPLFLVHPMGFWRHYAVNMMPLLRKKKGCTHLIALRTCLLTATIPSHPLVLFCLCSLFLQEIMFQQQFVPISSIHLPKNGN